MNAENKCQREGCQRLRWNLTKRFCSSTCHFIHVNMADAERAARQHPESNIGSQWYANAVILADAINEITRLKSEYRTLRDKEILRG